MGNSIKKNYLFNLCYQIFLVIIPLITTPYISRVLQANGIGTYSYAYSIATYFTLFASLGTNSYGLREGARVRDDVYKRSKLFYELTILRILSTIVSIVMYIIIIYISNYNISIYLACSLSIISVAFDCSWYLQSLEQFQSLAIRNMLVKTVSMILIFMFVKTSDDLILYILLQTGGMLFANMILIGKVISTVKKIHICELNFTEHLKSTFVYFIPTIATSIYTVLDKTMIGIILNSPNENGYYEQAQKIINMLMALIISLSVVISARTSYLFSLNEHTKIKELIYKAFDYVMLVAFPMVLGIIVCANKFVPWFFGEGYEKVIYLMQLFSPLIIIIGISNILGEMYFTPSGQRAKSSKFIIVGAIVNAILNLFLIPKFNTYGAVIASLCAESIITFLYLYFSKEYFNYKMIGKLIVEYFLISVIMAIPVYFIGECLNATYITTIIQVIIGGILYLFLLYITHNRILYESFDLLKNKLFKVKNNH